MDVSLLALRPVNKLFLSDLPKFAPNFEGARSEPPVPGFFNSCLDEAMFVFRLQQYTDNAFDKTGKFVVDGIIGVFGP